jgi:2-polyprenyl-6-hydroxyphenyl methylase/3-demethylubiquinone-9 3-methyltransferase
MCDLPKVISEISRVLKPGGVFIYDTLNRTFVSKVVAIKMARLEEVGFYAAQPACLENVYQTRRNKGTLSRNALRWQDHTGSQPNVSIPKMLGYLRKRVKGEWTFAELGKNFWLVESKDMNILYGGHAIKG